MAPRGTSKVYIALLAACALSTSSAAFGLSVATPPAFVNGVGQPVSAQAEFTFKPGSVTVSVQNNTDGARYFTQTLSGLKFKVKNYRGDPYMQTSRGNVRIIQGDGTPGAPAAEITNWIFEFKDGEFSLSAPGKNYTILPETGPNDYFNADSSLLASGKRPFITGPVSFLIMIPGMPTDEQIENVEFRFSDTGEDLGMLNGDLGTPSGSTDFGGEPAGTPSLTGGGTTGGSSWSPVDLSPQAVNPSSNNAPPGGAPSSGSGTSDSTPYGRNGNLRQPPPVPEAATLTVLAAGALVMLGRKKR